MATLEDRIAQFRKMATDDPENELGHFSLGRALMEAGALGEAAASFERTLALNPHFSKAYQLLGTCRLQLGQREQAVQALREGYLIADERGDRMPRDEMANLMRELGVEPPVVQRAASA
jgi:predicted Zn-dependent protease